MSCGKERKRKGKKVITLKQEYRDQLKISGRRPDVLVESRDKIYPSVQKWMLSSCRDLTWVCLQWNMLHSLHSGRRASPTWEPGSGEKVSAAQSVTTSCSSKRKGSEEREKVSCRRQIFFFVKYNFLFCIYHQHSHQLMETTGSLLPTAVVLYMLFSLPDQQEKAITGAWPMSCGFRPVF